MAEPDPPVGRPGRIRLAVQGQITITPQGDRVTQQHTLQKPNQKAPDLASPGRGLFIWVVSLKMARFMTRVAI
jgi:hypothetical protein